MVNSRSLSQKGNEGNEGNRGVKNTNGRAKNMGESNVVGPEEQHVARGDFKEKRG